MQQKEFQVASLKFQHPVEHPGRPADCCIYPSGQIDNFVVTCTVILCKKQTTKKLHLICVKMMQYNVLTNLLHLMRPS